MVLLFQCCAASAAEAKALSRKEKFGFAQMAAQQTMRDTPKGGEPCTLPLGCTVSG